MKAETANTDRGLSEMEKLRACADVVEEYAAAAGRNEAEAYRACCRRPTPHCTRSNAGPSGNRGTGGGSRHPAWTR